MGIAATCRAVADHGVLVTLATEVSDAAHAAIVALDRSLAEAPPKGMTETVPALVNLMVVFDPLLTDHGAIIAEIEARLTRIEGHAVQGKEHVVHVCYDPAFAPDLGAVAAQTGLTEAEVIAAHLETPCKVLMYGFSPGYAYLSGLPPEIRVPRKPAAVRDVPAGSVVIADKQCLVTTLTMPTGWSIIGRSPTRVLTGRADAPFLFEVGDSVRFERIDAATFERMDRESARG